MIPREIRSLVAFDHKVFNKPDWFAVGDWRLYEPWWMIVDERKVGCCAFELHKDFCGDVNENRENPCLNGSLYIATTGILPGFKRQGLGTLIKSWQICYARCHGFTRIVTNTRKSNRAMIALNRKFGFQIIRTIPRYYHEPSEPTVVMEIRL